MNTSLGVIPEMLYCNIVTGLQTPRFKARAGMKWFRSNVRHGSRLALFALAIQVLLSFGHFHVSGAQATPALMDGSQLGLHDTVTRAAAHLDAWARASHEDAFRPAGLKAPNHESDGRPTDDCAICAVMALANALVVATPSYLPGPQPASSLYLVADAEFIALNSARVVFQSRAPPIS